MSWWLTAGNLLPSWYKPPSQSSLRYLFYGIILGFSFSLTSTSLALFFQARRRQRLAAKDQFEPRPIELRSDEVLKGVTGLIGNTPLIRINSLSDALGVEILGKAEFLNPGGSVKDRVALRMIDDAETVGLLHPYTGSRIFEGTVGSTGISIATIARARGYDVTIIMPDDVADEKVKALHALGADIERVRPASIVDKKQASLSSFLCLSPQRALEFGRNFSSDRLHLVQAPSSMAVSTSGDEENPDDLINKPRGFFADQFENRSNHDAHYDGTGPEIWRQTNGSVNAFVSGAGGTVAGVGRFLKSMNEEIVVAISDPEGSGLYNKVSSYIKYGVMFDSRESEGTKRRHQVDTVVEGIGINRLTDNISLALPIVDDAFRITDAEAVAMSRYLVQHDGLFLGSSSACNLLACIKLVRKMEWKEGQTIVTILCDSGNRHYSKFWNDEYLEKAGIPIDPELVTQLLSSS
ncbi:tryptophan synthase beta subunit-like PLP-dependent enzyme [Lentinula boryana]|uniref:Tryptophan synthase beta subunit-like PLP-dependent enzyme n=1 Tax=Lentinula boryana TaxID=40481 RepID=A0ABQ8QEQ1_9AGAR|nr:tryptophan synthase beta subunit-like PLP-dependent enzyme [Lentinula boryana]